MKAYALYHPDHGFLSWNGWFEVGLDEEPPGWDENHYAQDPVVQPHPEPKLKSLYTTRSGAVESIKKRRVWTDMGGTEHPHGRGRCVITGEFPYPKIAEFPLDEVEIKEVQISW